MLMIDAMCTRYHCLPSYALQHASTIDLYVLTNVVGYHRRKSMPATEGMKKEYSQTELLAILNRNKAQ